MFIISVTTGGFIATCVTHFSPASLNVTPRPLKKLYTCWNQENKLLNEKESNVKINKKDLVDSSFVKSDNKVDEEILKEEKLPEISESTKNVIDNLSISGGDFAGVFENLKSGLSAPLSGMGTAFSSSLFGLAGSLVLGFLDLQASQSQNRFYNDLEEWLSSYTRLSSGSGIGEGDQSVPAYVQALLEQTADSLENLQRTISRSEESRGSAQNTLMALVDKLSILTDQMKAEQGLMVKLAENQMEIRPVLQSLTNHLENQESGLDEASRGHLRNLDNYVVRLLAELSEGRNQTVAELRSEIKLLARTIAAMADGR